MSTKTTFRAEILARLAFAGALLVILGTVISLILMVEQGLTAYVATTLAGIAITLSNGAVAVLILRRHPSHTVGWLLLLICLVFAARLLGRIPIFLALGGWLDPSTQLVVLSHWFEQWNYLPAILLPVLFLPLYFPTGKLLSKQWRVFSMAGGLGLALVIGGVILSPGNYLALYDGESPLRIPGGDQAGSVLVYLIVPLLFLATVGAALSVVLRYKQSTAVQRTQLKWLFLPLGIYVFWNLGILTPIHLVAPGFVDQFLQRHQYADFWLMSIFVPVAIGIAILRHNLFNIEIAVNRALVYGILSAMIVFLYVAIISLAGLVVEAQTTVLSGLLATGVVAVIAHPLRERLQRGVNRILYGERDEPEVLFSRLAQNLERAESPAQILPNLAKTMAQTLKVPYVAILTQREQGDLTLLADWGKPAERHEKVDLTYNNRSVGRLLVAPRSTGERFTAQERALLNTIAALTAVAVRSVQLAEDLRQSRRRIITAREEERRRIQRDLHDGLGPALAAHMIQIGNAHALVERDPSTAKAILRELESDIEHSLVDIRRLVYNLRPPTLDQLGLIPALQEFVYQYNHGKDRTTQFELVAPAELPKLPAAVEVAAYRIVQEAVNNVLRHAQAAHCVVHLEWEGNLKVSVEDDGVGRPAGFMYGVGIDSMHERAEELGGSLEIQPARAGGTRIVAELPFTAVTGVNR